MGTPGTKPCGVCFLFCFFILPSWKTQDVSLHSLSQYLFTLVFVCFFCLFKSQRERGVFVDTSCNIQQNFVNWQCLQSVSCISSIKSWSGNNIPSSRPIAAWTIGKNGRQGKEIMPKDSRNPTTYFPSFSQSSTLSSGCHQDLNLIFGFSC